ncbi:hypothetical protein M885DRAFT_550553 [Pelagophyceae sp. CCMP2097]|nr:hypothetical protein M885DRAFT_550553 [Pelagophyceae sp. CCMP2097]
MQLVDELCNSHDQCNSPVGFKQHQCQPAGVFFRRLISRAGGPYIRTPRRLIVG